MEGLAPFFAFRLLLASCLILSTSALPPRSRYILKPQFISVCRNYDLFPNHFGNFKIYRPAGAVPYFSTDLMVAEPGGRTMKGVMELYNCSRVAGISSSRRDGDCDHFLTLEYRNFCDTLTDVDAVWSKFFSSSTPEFVCPFNRGKYRFTDVVPDLRDALRFAETIPTVARHRWVTKMSIYRRNKPWACFEMGMDVVDT